jgi:hypothetical protein
MCGMATLPDPAEATTPEEVDLRAKQIGDVFEAAIEGAGIKQCDRGFSALWWNNECKAAYTAYRGAE